MRSVGHARCLPAVIGVKTSIEHASITPDFHFRVTRTGYTIGPGDLIAEHLSDAR